MKTACAPLIYSTAMFARQRVERSEVVWEPTSTIHAKELGTSRTVCGESSANWVKLWTRPFDPSSGDSCQGCVDAPRRRSNPQHRAAVARDQPESATRTARPSQTRSWCAIV